MRLLLIFLVVLGAEVATATRYLHQTEPSPLLPSMPYSIPEPPILINAPLAESTMPAVMPCPTIDNNMVDAATLMPVNSVYKPVFQVQANGNRNYSCGPDGVGGDSLSLAEIIPVPGAPYFLGGEGYYNIDGLPQINFRNPADNSPAGTIIADSTRTAFDGLGDTLKWRRWRILLIEGPVLPWVQYIVMNATSGGEKPPPEACAEGQEWVTSPYSATYTYWTC